MTRFPIFLVLSLALAACAASPPVSTGYLPANSFGNSVQGQDPTVAATNDATVAFAYPRQMWGRPADMALAIASLDALAGQFSTGGRFFTDADAQMQLLTARERVRAILGVPQTAASQSVIDHLVAASHALQRGDQPAALIALTGPDFTLSPTQTLAILTHFPYVPAADSAMFAAGQAEFPQDGGGLAGV
jgi:hypothetical protein